MTVLSVVPSLGTAIVWVPVVGYLFAVGRSGAAILLLIWCSVGVGTIDNFLRPALVGKDTKMPDLRLSGHRGPTVLRDVWGGARRAAGNARI